ncbi:PAS/PAC sensor signal transduction histidine kinase [Alteromonadaceae bacterium Bs31]|nr:PAS/PAC sensor signal transduction histidine kinase [Alteromonadaceae bacterium Bs31]
MNEALVPFFRGDYMPHGHCYLWQPEILWTHVISDAIIAVSYFSIPIALYYFVVQKQIREFRWIFLLFALFILACGITHLMGIVTIWQGVYGLHGLTKALTALVSITTAITLFKVLPYALRLPSSAELEAAHKRAHEEQARVSRMKLQQKADAIFKFALDLFPTGLVVVDAKQNIVLANHTFARTFGYDAEELINHPLSQLLTTGQQAHHSLQVSEYLKNPVQKHAMAAGRYVKGITKNRSEVAIEISLSVHEYEGEKHAFASVIASDEVLSQHSANSEITNRIKRAIDATNDGLWEWNVQTNQVWFSARMMRMIGCHPEKDQPQFEQWLAHIHPDDKPMLQRALAKHFNEQDTFDVIYRGISDSSEFEWLHIRGNTIFDKSKRPILMSGTLTNINKIKTLQEELSQKTHFLNQFLNKSLAGAYLFDLKNFNNTFINKQYTEITGYNLEDLQLVQNITGILPLVHPEDQDDFAKHLREVIDSDAPSGVAIEYRFKHKDGHWIWCYSRDSIYSRDTNGAATTMLGSFFNISELKERENRIKQLAQNFENTFEQAAVGIAHISLDRKWLKTNRRLCDILNTSPESLMSAPFEKSVLDKDRDIDEIQMQELRSGKIKQYSVEKRLIREGHDIFWANLTISLVNGDKADNSYFIVVVEDITDRKAVAQALSESNASLERFAYSASHDLQEPLRKISAFSDSLDRRLIGKVDDPEARYELNRISDAAKRMRGMIDSLLQLSRYSRNKIDKVSTSLDQLLCLVKDDMSKIISESGASIELLNDAKISVDASGFQQVLRNLISNSIRYAKPDEPAKIRIDSEVMRNKTIISVSDEGKGFHLQYAEQIFEPFKRLVGREIPGSGMGLALCRQIVKAHGGSISARSNFGGGAIFTIELPPESK